MSWGPNGPTTREERPVTKAELEAELAKREWASLREFISMIKDGDDLQYQAESNRNRGYARYVGRRGAVCYTLVIFTRMS